MYVHIYIYIQHTNLKSVCAYSVQDFSGDRTNEEIVDTILNGLHFDVGELLTIHEQYCTLNLDEKYTSALFRNTIHERLQTEGRLEES